MTLQRVVAIATENADGNDRVGGLVGIIKWIVPTTSYKRPLTSNVHRLFCRMGIISNLYKYLNITKNYCLSIRDLLFFFISLFILNIITYCSHNVISTSTIDPATKFDLTCTNGTASTEKVSVENTENCVECNRHYRLESMLCVALDIDGDGILDITDVDADGDGLIEIETLNDLATIRDDLDGNGVDDGLLDDVVALGKTGCGGLNNITACIGYELIQNLDFADNSSYVGSKVNMSWRPLSTSTVEGSSMIVSADDGQNAGWIPIGDCNDDGDSGSVVCGDSNDKSFSAIFEGNGFTIRNLYARDTGSTGVGVGLGFFALTGSASKIRNVGLVEYTIFGGSGNDYVGGLVGYNAGGITASYATGNADGGSGNDLVGGLMGLSGVGNIIASYATGNVNGGGGDDNLGGLVGQNSGASIIASYATGNVNGGANDNVGGLVGGHIGNIIASYATGNVDGGANDNVGGLVGKNFGGGSIRASYAFGSVDGGNDIGTPPTGVTMFTLTKDTANMVVSGMLVDWDLVWDFGTDTQPPALKYADYDGTGNSDDVDYCKLFLPLNITCGETLLPGQGR